MAGTNLPLATEEEAAGLLALPDHVLLCICDFLLVHDKFPLRLGALCAAHATLNRTLSSTEADELWTTLCRRHGVIGSADESPKAVFGRHATTLCHDCHSPTRYEFALLRRRLCESCERASPHLYGLVTLQQLIHERSVVAELSGTQQARLFGGGPASLPSITRGSQTWFLRPHAVAVARSLLGERECDEAPDQASEPPRGGAARTHRDSQPSTVAELVAQPEGAPSNQAASQLQAATVDEDEEDEEAALDLAGEWEAAAAVHTAQRKPGSKQRAQQRDERKAHKRKVKTEQRERRQSAEAGVLPSGLVAPRAAAGSSGHKPKRVSASEHRAAASHGATRVIERLEAEFGEDLCGLSGLVLADGAT